MAFHVVFSQDLTRREICNFKTPEYFLEGTVCQEQKNCQIQFSWWVLLFATMQFVPTPPFEVKSTLKRKRTGSKNVSLIHCFFVATTHLFKKVLSRCKNDNEANFCDRNSFTVLNSERERIVYSCALKLPLDILSTKTHSKQRQFRSFCNLTSIMLQKRNWIRKL